MVSQAIQFFFGQLKFSLTSEMSCKSTPSDQFRRKQKKQYLSDLEASSPVSLKQTESKKETSLTKPNKRINELNIKVI